MMHKQGAAMANTLAHSRVQLSDLADSVIRMALQEGASDAQVMFNESTGLLLEMRQGRLKTRTRASQSSLFLTVYRGHHQGTTSSTNYSSASLRETVQAACRIAGYTGEDRFAGLAEARFLCRASDELDLWHPWNLDEVDATALAQRIEAGIVSAGDDVISDGVTVHTGHSDCFIMNSHGFSCSERQSNHLMAARALARKQNRSLLDFHFSVARHAQSLMAPEEIGRRAGNGAIAALDTAPLQGSQRCPVLFDAKCALSLLDHLVQATSGSVLYHRNSFLADRLGETVFSDHVSVTEDPFAPQGLASRSFDGDGIGGTTRKIVNQGILAGFFLSAYAARHLDMAPTGNGWGPGNLSLNSSLTQKGDDFDAMVKKLHTGLIVTSFSGGGPRLINGDYSRSLRGFWAEGGQIRYAVDGVTVAGNLAEMFRNIVAIGTDVITQGALTSGSVLIDNLQVAGR